MWKACSASCCTPRRGCGGPLDLSLPLLKNAIVFKNAAAPVKKWRACKTTSFHSVAMSHREDVEGLIDLLLPLLEYAIVVVSKLPETPVKKWRACLTTCFHPAAIEPP